MRHTLLLRGLAVVVLILTAPIASAQNPVSDSDFISMIHPVRGTNDDWYPNRVDTNFAVAVMIDHRTVIGAISIPLDFSGVPELNIDTTISTPPDVLGVTYGPAGCDTSWTLKSSLVDNSNKWIVLGFVSFTGVLPHDDTLCYIHWDLDSSGISALITVDSTSRPPFSGLRITTADILNPTDYRPQWTPIRISIGYLQAGAPAFKPSATELHANYPNPFNAITTMHYVLSAPTSVTLSIHNILGQRVRTLVDRPVAAGEHTVSWDGRDDRGNTVASGVYLIVLQAGEERKTRRALLLK